MTTPSDSNSASVSADEGTDPYTGESAVPVTETAVERHPYASQDFGLTPRAIDPALAFPSSSAPQPSASGGDSPDSSDDTNSVTSAVKEHPWLSSAAAAAGTAAIASMFSSDDDSDKKQDKKQDKREKHEKTRLEKTSSDERKVDPYTGETYVREDSRNADSTARRRRLLRSGDIGIYVPLGFLVIAGAVALAMWLFQLSGRALSIGLLLLLLMLLLTGVTTVELMATTRRRRKAGEDLSHAIGLE